MPNAAKPSGLFSDPRSRVGRFTLALVFASLLFQFQPTQAQTYRVLYNFTGGADGRYPEGGLTRTSAGLFGTTTQDGVNGFGTVFRLDKAGLTILHNFTGGTDGGEPVATLIADASGSVYGTTKGGGAFGFGTLFTVDAMGAYTVLYSFKGSSYGDGAAPRAKLRRDSAGNFYGTTGRGGDPACNPSYGCGTIFKIDINGAEHVLYSFEGTPKEDGDYPSVGALVTDGAGSVYDTTTVGGVYGEGTVYKFGGTGVTVLHSFTGGADGARPTAGLVRDSAGNYYGATILGGEFNQGTVFSLDVNGIMSVLHSFSGDEDGLKSLVIDPAGVLYGTTVYGGAYGLGTVFRLEVNGTKTILHSFNSKDGAHPFAELLRDRAGNLYGTTFGGGTYDQGVVFRLNP